MKEYKCLKCENIVSKNRKYCSNKCQRDAEYQCFLKKWFNNEIKHHPFNISHFIRRFCFERAEYKCEECGWNKIHSKTKTSPLQIHHIDNDSTNNDSENLKVLCPNCHSLTDNFGSRNKGSGRYQKRLEYEKLKLKLNQLL